MRGIVGICGTPGTGKKTISPMVAKLMGLPPAVSLNSLVPKGDVDTTELRRELLKVVKGRAVVFGHLLPHVLSKSEVAIVAVLRCDPSMLRSRLERRRYPMGKVTENVEAELIGVLLDECVRRFGSALVREYDTTLTQPEVVAETIAKDAEAAARGGQARRPQHAWIDWTLDYDSSSKLRSLLGGESAPAAST